MKKNEAQQILAGNSLDLLTQEVGAEAAPKYTLLVGRFQAAHCLGDTHEKIQADNGWIVLAIPTAKVEMVGTTIRCQGARIIKEDDVSGPGAAHIGDAGSVVAGIWQWDMD